MHDIVKQKQRELCDQVLEQLHKELVELETTGFWEDASRCQKMIDEWEERKEGIPK